MSLSMPLSNKQINICEKGNLEDILSLINQGCDGNRIFQYTCYYGHIKVVEYLVEKCGVNARASDDYAVQTASVGGYFEVIKYLVEKCGANARANDDFAIRHGYDHLEVVKYLIEDCGANARANDDFAIRHGYGHLEVVKYLIEDCGANARANDDYAVRMASSGGYLEVVKYLVEKCGANARAKNDYAVQCASRYDCFEVVKYLVEKCGAILSVPNPKYERYLSVCEKGEKKRKCIMAKKIYFWWVQTCYNPDTLCGQRSMYKGYREYLNIR